MGSGRHHYRDGIYRVEKCIQAVHVRHAELSGHPRRTLGIRIVEAHHLRPGNVAQQPHVVVAQGAGANDAYANTRITRHDQKPIPRSLASMI